VPVEAARTRRGPIDLTGRPGILLGLAGVLLAIAVAMADSRFEDDWSNGVHLAVTGIAFLVVFGLGAAGAPRHRPPGAQSALLATGLVLLLAVLNYLAEVLGADDPIESTGSLSWILALYTSVAAGAAFRYRSAVCALFAGVAATGLAVSLVNEISDPKDIETFRWVLFVTAVALAAGAVAVRRFDRGDGAPYGRHAVQLVNAAAIALFACGATVVVSLIQFSFGDDADGDAELGVGWEMALVFGALAMILYAIVRSEPGPGYLGFLLASEAVVVTTFPAGGDAEDPSLLGWPLVLLVLALAAAALAFLWRREGAPSTGDAPPPAGDGPGAAPPAGGPPPPGGTPPGAPPGPPAAPPPGPPRAT
jgi:hypothetical protein